MHRLDRLAYAAELSDESAEKVTALMRELCQAHDNDATAVERAFSDAVRAAWVQGEAWAKEWVERATGPGGNN